MCLFHESNRMDTYFRLKGLKRRLGRNEALDGHFSSFAARASRAPSLETLKVQKTINRDTVKLDSPRTLHTRPGPRITEAS